MSVLVDTSVWSLAFRRRYPPGGIADELARLIDANRALLVGPVRQELLSGTPQREQFERLRNLLAVFPDEPILSEDYVQAAVCFSRCRTRGVQGSHIDFLICAVALRLGASVFTTDRDFAGYREVLGFTLHQPEALP